MHLLFCILLILNQKTSSGWEIFEETRFKWQFDYELGLEVELPIFNKKVKELEGKEIILAGHYLPLDLQGNNIIISKLPYAACFFCGGDVGQESVAEVQFNAVQRPFRLDEVIAVKGRLKLNIDDYDHLVFQIIDARLIQP